MNATSPVTAWSRLAGIKVPKIKRRCAAGQGTRYGTVDAALDNYGQGDFRHASQLESLFAPIRQ
jgi:hypothetical protein